MEGNKSAQVERESGGYIFLLKVLSYVTAAVALILLVTSVVVSRATDDSHPFFLFVYAGLHLAPLLSGALGIVCVVGAARFRQSRWIRAALGAVFLGVAGWCAYIVITMPPL